jgi:hypothetical protein
MRVHAFANEGFGPNAVTADLTRQIAHHADGRKRTRRGAVLGQRGDGRQRKKPEAKNPACNG